MTHRRIRNSALALSAAALLTVAAAGQAGASTAASMSVASARAANCVHVSHSSGYVTQTVKVTNDCASTISFSVRRVGPDSPCFIVGPHRWRSYKWGNGLNYQGIRWNCS
ncbi:hypothetical protein AB0D67_09415 [Streptosporangium sp. NPDC048047]|uniref:hypothetical protein n=1 Tax=Streptosporangium sp. NPDC048047 TaxID=3155748 RepID=UPI003421630A